ncbi:sulfate adenylyltransferase subunit CysN [bacterium]|nr:sulfate adenylyltransferase subunit CysN [bacterium]
MAETNVQELLHQTQEADLLRFTTAGSVDDGKSTMIGRLIYDSKGIYEDQLESVIQASKNLNRDDVDLALLLDGLRSEREQGITIDVAYRYFSTPKRRFIIADTPGHVQYTRNMVTGASTANLAVVLIDAKNGVLTQSKRHGFIASLLGIPHIVVAVNKMDLVGYDKAVFNKIRKTYSEFAAKLNITDLAYIPMSALKGDNVVNKSENMPWYKGVALLNHLENVYIGSDRNLIDFRFPVQCVNRPNQGFRGYCGQVVSGVIRVGSEIMVLPSGKKSRVKRIATYDGDLEYVFPPQSVTLCLEDEIDITRGDMIVHPRNLPKLEREFESMLVWMSDEPLRLNKQYLIKNSTNVVRARISELFYRVDPDDLHRENAETLQLNEIGRVVVDLFKAVPYDEYRKNRATGGFIIIDPMTNATLGAGMIIDRSRYRASVGNNQKKIVSKHISRKSGEVTDTDRQRLLAQKPVTIWLTGLSGSGKSTIGYGIEKRLVDDGHACYVLDGDNVRHGLNRDLGFSPKDRKENIRRIAEVARLFNESGLIVVTSFISPYRADRESARNIIGETRFFEIHIDAPVEICEERDPKGLYKKARAGEIPEFTGVSAPYESPETPSLQIATDKLDVRESVDAVIAMLKEKGILNE